MAFLLIGLFAGILIGIFTEHFIFPYFDIKFELFVDKYSIKKTQYQLDAQELAFNFAREYPESQNNNQELQPCIGFQYPAPLEEEEYYEEED
jgi:hypothetical protein